MVENYNFILLLHSCYTDIKNCLLFNYFKWLRSYRWGIALYKSHLNNMLNNNFTSFRVYFNLSLFQLLFAYFIQEALTLCFPQIWTWLPLALPEHLKQSSPYF